MKLSLSLLCFAFLATSQLRATTLASPSSRCDLMIRELRAGGEIPPNQMLAKMREIYRHALIASLTIADLEGLRDAPLTFNNWSDPIFASSVGEHLKIVEEFPPKLDEVNRTKLLNEIIPSMIKKAIEDNNSSKTGWDKKQEDLRQLAFKVLKGHVLGIRALALSRDGTILFSGSNDQTVRKWDIVTGKLLHIFGNYNGTVQALALSPDEKLLFVATDKKIIRAFNLKTNKVWYTLEGQRKPPQSLVISSDGKFLYSGSDNDSIRQWNLETQSLEHIFDQSHGESILTLTKDDHKMISGSFDSHPTVWDLSSRSPLYKLQGRSNKFPHGPFALSRDDKMIYSIIPSKEVRAWDLQTGRILFTLKHPKKYIVSIALSPDEKFLYTGRSHGIIYQWDLAKREIVQIFEGHKDAVTPLTLTPDSKTLISGAHDNTIRLWDLERLPPRGNLP
jgi:WD40 repeat protein